jgi:hypothetical protein
MKLAAASFFLLLLFVHWTPDPERVLDQPLSTFRDDSRAWLGYALFATLLLAGGLYVAALARSDRVAEAIISALGVLILLTVALTPSTDGLHLFCSLVLFALLFGYYAIVLYRAEPILLFVHLIVPFALVFAIRFHSYGLWQKGFIAYFVLLAAVHHHVLTHQRFGGQAPSAADPVGYGQSRRRRKVYRMEAEEHWRRGNAR